MSGRVAAMVLARDRPEPTERTLAAILAQQPVPDRVLAIDNDSTPEVRAVFERFPDVEVLSLTTNHGCAGGFEQGLRRLLEDEGLDYVIGFDDDATPLPGCVDALLAAAAELPDIAALGAVSHTEDGTLAWPMLVEGERDPATTVGELRALALRHEHLRVPNHSWHGMLLPVEVMRRHGIVWGELFLQYEDIELGMRYRGEGLHFYVVPDAECLHPAPPPARAVRVLGRQIDVTAQNPAKEYLTLRNGLVVRRLHEGARFWYGTGPFVLLRGLLSSLALDVPRGAALRHVFLRGILDAIRGRLGPPPAVTARLARSPRHNRRRARGHRRNHDV